jgi:hypothetical protein
MSSPLSNGKILSLDWEPTDNTSAQFIAVVRGLPLLTMQALGPLIDPSPLLARKLARYQKLPTTIAATRLAIRQIRQMSIVGTLLAPFRLLCRKAKVNHLVEATHRARPS